MIREPHRILLAAALIATVAQPVITQEAPNEADLFSTIERYPFSEIEFREAGYAIPNGGVLGSWKVTINEDAVKQNAVAFVTVPGSASARDSNQSPRFPIESQDIFEEAWKGLSPTSASGASVRFVEPGATGNLSHENRVFEIVPLNKRILLLEFDPYDYDEIVAPPLSRLASHSGWWSPGKCKNEMSNSRMPRVEIEMVIYYSRYLEEKYKGRVENYIKEKVALAGEPLGKGTLHIDLIISVKKWEGKKLDRTGLAYALKELQKASKADPDLLPNIADVAIFLYDSGPKDACGRAISFPSKKHSWAVAAEECRNSTKHVFAHEIGHFFGGRHENLRADPRYAHPYSLKSDFTIMDSQYEAEAEYFVYSHPPLAGSYPYSNNTCVLRQIAPRISDYH